MKYFPTENLPDDWKQVVEAELEKPYAAALAAFLAERENKALIHPDLEHWFYALETCPLNSVRVVILGQDPYHGPGQAHGLAFSVRAGIKAPPSLVNIFKEICREFGGEPNKQDPFLVRWAAQGVLLLNTVLTVEEGNAGAHRGKGWETFTDAVISAVAVNKPGTVFMLWGNEARAKKELLSDGHLILEAPHPSPLSAHRGFFGCGHFRAANQWLEKRGGTPIRWVK